VPSPGDDVRDDAVGEHGDDVSGAREHERVRVPAVGEQVPERLVGVAEEVHERGAEEHAAGELRAQRQERFVPPHEVGGHAAGQRAREHHRQAPQLRRHHPARAQVGLRRRVPAVRVRVRAGSTAVVAARGGAMAGRGRRRKCVCVGMEWNGG
jgi:hypothetical protein